MTYNLLIFFLKKNNIKYILFNPKIKIDLILDSKAANNLYNLFPNQIDNINLFKKTNNKKLLATKTFHLKPLKK